MINEGHVDGFLFGLLFFTGAWIGFFLIGSAY